MFGLRGKLILLTLCLLPPIAAASCTLNSKGFCVEDPNLPQCQGTGGTGGGGSTSDGGSTSSSTGGSTNSSGGSGGMNSGGSGGAGGSTSSSGGGGTGGMAPICGDDVKDSGEACDGSDFGGKTCVDYKGLGSAGTLTCTNSCTTIDFADCTLPTCVAGMGSTIDSMVVGGSPDISTFIHFNSGADYYSTSSPANPTFAGKESPLQAVMTGNNGLGFNLKKAGAALAKPLYKVNLASLSGIPECSVVKSQLCASGVAKSFRCQNAPYWESSGCPTPAVSFTALPSASNYNDASSGLQMVLVDGTCAP